MFAAVFVAEIGDVARFATADKLTCWAGLTPRHRESDTTVHRGRVTKQGSKLVRWAAVEAVQRSSEPAVAAIRTRIADAAVDGPAAHRAQHRQGRRRPGAAQAGLLRAARRPDPRPGLHLGPGGVTGAMGPRAGRGSPLRLTPVCGGVVEKLIDPVQARPVSLHARRRTCRRLRRNVCDSGPPEPRPMIIVEPHAQPNTPRPGPEEKRRAVLAGVKAKPLRGGLRPALTPAAVDAAQNPGTGPRNKALTDPAPSGMSVPECMFETWQWWRTWQPWRTSRPGRGWPPPWRSVVANWASISAALMSMNGLVSASSTTTRSAVSAGPRSAPARGRCWRRTSRIPPGPPTWWVGVEVLVPFHVQPRPVALGQTGHVGRESRYSNSNIDTPMPITNPGRVSKISTPSIAAIAAAKSALAAKP